MKQPGAITYLSGNLLTLLMAGLAALYAGYHALVEGGSGWLAIAAVIATSHCANCHRQLNAYGRWKREWDAMNGTTERPSIIGQMAWLRYLVGSGIWLMGIGLAATNHDPGLKWAVVLFWIATLLGLAVAIFRAFQHLRMREVPVQTVAIHLNVPIYSMAAMQTGKLVPEYCTQLLQPGNGSPK